MVSDVTVLTPPEAWLHLVGLERRRCDRRDTYAERSRTKSKTKRNNRRKSCGKREQAHETVNTRARHEPLCMRGPRSKKEKGSKPVVSHMAIGMTQRYTSGKYIQYSGGEKELYAGLTETLTHKHTPHDGRIGTLPPL